MKSARQTKRRHWRPSLGQLGLLLAQLAWVACSPPAPHSDVSDDLVRLFPYTASGREAARIDLGRDGAEWYLLQGWSAPERLPTGELAVRAVRRESALRFGVHAPQALRMIVRCALVSSGSPRPQRVRVRLNHRWLAPLVPRPELADYAVELPADAQQPGVNVIKFSHLGLSRRTPKDPRTLDTVAYESVRFETPDGQGTGAFVAHDDPAAEALVVPAGSQIDYFLRLPTDGKLAFQIARGRDAEAAQALITLQPEGEPDRVLWTHSAPATANIDVAADAAKVARLSIKAEGSGPLRLVRPRVTGTAPGPRQREPQPPLQRRPNVLLYIVDTLRADHLGCYGYAPPTTPHLDKFAADATIFTHAVAQASWTRPATASILTGRYPYGHGAIGLSDSLRPDVATLAEVLRAHGYTTSAFVTNVNVSAPFGFQRGFDQFTYLPEDEARASMHVLSNELIPAVGSWLASRGAPPFFLYVHATDPHAPYTPPPELADQFRDPSVSPSLLGAPTPLRQMLADETLITPANVRYLISLYDAEIASADAGFGQLIDTLKRQDLYKDTIIVFVADHGEEFYDHHGFEHGHALYQELLRIPLVMRLPGLGTPGQHASTLARQIDIMPTLLDHLGIPPPTPLDGRSLLPMNDRGTEAEATEAFSQTSLGGQIELAALSLGTTKVIRKNGGQDVVFEAFDLATDPQEQHPLGRGVMPVLREYAAQSIERWIAEGAGGRREEADQHNPTIDPATAERLRMLGYTQ